MLLPWPSPPSDTRNPDNSAAGQRSRGAAPGFGQLVTLHGDLTLISTHVKTNQVFLELCCRNKKTFIFVRCICTQLRNSVIRCHFPVIDSNKLENVPKTLMFGLQRKLRSRDLWLDGGSAVFRDNAGNQEGSPADQRDQSYGRKI